MTTPRCTITEARNNIKLQLNNGLINETEAKRARIRLLQIQASNRHWTLKNELYAIWGNLA